MDSLKLDFEREFTENCLWYATDLTEQMLEFAIQFMNIFIFGSFFVSTVVFGLFAQT